VPGESDRGNIGSKRGKEKKRTASDFPEEGMEASQGPGADIWREEEAEAGGDHHSRATGPGYDEHAEEYATAASVSASARKGVIKDPKSPLLGRRMSPESR